MSDYANTRHDDGLVRTRFITRNGKRIYHPTGGIFVFPDTRDKKPPKPPTEG